MWGARAHVFGGARWEAGHGIPFACAAGRSTPLASEHTPVPAGGSAPLAESGSGASLPPTVPCCSVPARARAALCGSAAQAEGEQQRPRACAQVGDFEMRVQRSLTGGGGRGSFADSASVNGASSADSAGAAEAAAPAVLDMPPPPAGTAFVSTYSMDSTVLLPEPEPEVKMMSTQSLDEDLEDESTIYLGSPKARRVGSPCTLQRPYAGLQVHPPQCACTAPAIRAA